MKYVMYGGGYQAKNVLEVLSSSNHQLLAIFDDTKNKISPFPGIQIISSMKEREIIFEAHQSEELGFVVAIGNPNAISRLKFSAEFLKNGLVPLSVISSHAYISDDAVVGLSAQIMPGAVIMRDVLIENNCIVLSRANISHDCILKEGCEVGPGATLTGCVEISELVTIGAGAVILPGVKIGKNSIIGAGAVVTKNIPPGVVAIGNPARVLRDVE